MTALQPRGTDPSASSPDLVNVAWRLYRAGREDESRATFRRAVDEGVRAADAWYGLGELSRRGGDLDAAAANYREALAVHAGHSNAIFRLGTLAERRGDAGAAKKHYLDALAVHPEHVAAQRAVKALSAPAPKAPPEPADLRRTLAVQPSGRAIAGPVHGVQFRMEQDSSRRGMAVLSFRVQPEDGPPVAVELRGRSIAGHVINGEWVELPAGWSPGSSARRVVNLTTGSTLSIKRPRILVRAAFGALVTFVSLWIAVLCAAVVAQAFFGINLFEEIRRGGLEELLAG